MSCKAQSYNKLITNKKNIIADDILTEYLICTRDKNESHQIWKINVNFLFVSGD